MKKWDARKWRLIFFTSIKVLIKLVGLLRLLYHNHINSPWNDKLKGGEKLENKKLLPLSIFVLSVSIVFGAIWIGRSLEKSSHTPVRDSPVIAEKGLFTESESAEYLNISLNEFKNILSEDENRKLKISESQISSYPAYTFIRYIELSNGKKMFSKNELDEWIKYNSK